MGKLDSPQTMCDLNSDDKARVFKALKAYAAQIQERLISCPDDPETHEYWQVEAEETRALLERIEPRD